MLVNNMDCEGQEVLWQPQEQSPFLSFKKELILLILSKLSISAVPTVSLICKQLNYCMNDPILWKQRCIILKASKLVYDNKWKEACKSFVSSRKFFDSLNEGTTLILVKRPRDGRVQTLLENLSKGTILGKGTVLREHPWDVRARMLKKYTERKRSDP